jgi:hypothetical protein
MYFLLVLLVPVLLLFNTRLAMLGLLAAIAWMYFGRTRPAKRPRHDAEPMYKAGYED